VRGWLVEDIQKHNLRKRIEEKEQRMKKKMYETGMVGECEEKGDLNAFLTKVSYRKFPFFRSVSTCK
jgi:hypothetical protein